ncbi:SOSS complex subunit C isoform X3 [Anolis sagrei]|uniref:SOSS complex subunit C isoform X3 n=1 Tax=Anolis sagrei TaxID=38937 RepID=UPI003520B23E
MASNPPGQGFQNKNRVAILAELDKEKRKLLMQNQSSTNHPGARILQPLYQTYELPIMKTMDPWLVLLFYSASLSLDPPLIRTSAIMQSSST